MVTYLLKFSGGWQSSYSCWSRGDYSETFLKENISISSAFRTEEYNASFFTNFDYNGTHVKCQTDEDWADKWFDVSNQYVPVFPIACITSDAPVADFRWSPRYGLYVNYLILYTITQNHTLDCKSLDRVDITT